MNRQRTNGGKKVPTLSQKNTKPVDLKGAEETALADKKGKGLLGSAPRANSFESKGGGGYGENALLDSGPITNENVRENRFSVVWRSLR